MIDRVGIAVDNLLTDAWNGNDAADLHKRIARAAIEAMREPTHEQLSAMFGMGVRSDTWWKLVDVALQPSSR